MQQRRWWSALAVAAFTLAFVGAGAAPAAAETRLVVEGGYEGTFRAGQPLPVHVTVTTDRLLTGTLEVFLTGRASGSVRASLPVEVPAGSPKQFTLVIPSDPWNDPNEVAVRLNGDESARARTEVRTAPDVELVGLLPGVAAGREAPSAVPLAVDVGTARFVVLDEGDLDAAPGAFGPLSMVAAAAGELETLPPTLNEAIRTWVAGGGTLIVDEPAGARVPGLPDAWQPGPDGRALAGAGFVVAAGGAFERRDLAGALLPTDRTLPNATHDEFGLSLADPIARDAGLRLPALGLLVGVMAAYLVFVGPVLMTVLRRRGRAELAWVAIPLTAVVFSVGTYGVGTGLRRSVTLAHASVVDTRPGDVTATSFVGLLDRRGGDPRVTFPAGWEGRNPELQSFGPTRGAARFTRSPGAVEAVLDLDPGEFGLVAASGSAGLEDIDGQLAVEASQDPNGLIVGTVTNRTGLDLEEVAVFAAGGGQRVHSLAAGASQDFSIAPQSRINQPFATVAPELWPGATTYDGGPDLDGVVAYPLWLHSANSRFGTQPTGLAVAAGWTRDFEPPVAQEGRPPRSGRTLVTGLGAIGAGPSGAGAHAFRRTVVRGRVFDDWNGLTAEPGQPAVLRFDLPDGVDPTRLVLRAPANVGPEVWHDGTWTAAVVAAEAALGAEPEPHPQRLPGGRIDGERGGAVRVPMPPDARRFGWDGAGSVPHRLAPPSGGSVFVRFTSVGGEPVPVAGIELEEAR